MLDYPTQFTGNSEFGLPMFWFWFICLQFVSIQVNSIKHIFCEILVHWSSENPVFHLLNFKKKRRDDLFEIMSIDRDTKMASKIYAFLKTVKF